MLIDCLHSGMVLNRPFNEVNLKWAVLFIDDEVKQFYNSTITKINETTAHQTLKCLQTQTHYMCFYQLKGLHGASEMTCTSLATIIFQVHLQHKPIHPVKPLHLLAPVLSLDGFSAKPMKVLLARFKDYLRSPLIDSESHIQEQ